MILKDFEDSGTRWIPDGSGSAERSDRDSTLTAELRGIILYNNRGFRLRFDRENADNTDPPPAEDVAVSVILEAADEYDPETGSWQAWSEERRTTVGTVDALLATIADWSTDIGENDRLSRAGMHAVLDSFRQ